MILLILFIFISASSIPEGYNSFSMQINEKSKIEYTRVANGGWKSSVAAGVLQINGTKIVYEKEVKDLTKLIKAIGFNEKTDWSQVEGFSFDRIECQIVRNENGIDFIINEGGKSGKSRTIKVLWL